MFSSVNKKFGCCSEILVAATKKIFVVPNFVAVTKPFFSVCEVGSCDPQNLRHRSFSRDCDVANLSLTKQGVSKLTSMWSYENPQEKHLILG